MRNICNYFIVVLLSLSFYNVDAQDALDVIKVQDVQETKVAQDPLDVIKVQDVQETKVVQAAQEVKSTSIGVINIDIVLQQSKKGQAILSEFNKNQTETLKLVDEEVKVIEAKEKEMQTGFASMSFEEQNKATMNFEISKSNIMREKEDLELSFQRKMEESIGVIERAIQPIIKHVAQEKGMEVVLKDGSSYGIMFIGEGVDITSDVIKIYDQQEE